ncbi:MAG: DCC1-like thiol-disulfide oxidoreductase family protein [Cyanobacteria bacterium P01_A01_bin.135]
MITVSMLPHAMYYVIYDGSCNLCVNLVKALETIDQGQRFRYIPMQDDATLSLLRVTPQTCQAGMIVIDQDDPQQRWQGSDAAEKIGQLLPASQPVVAAYLSVPGLKSMGDRVYAQVRDNRYRLFGKRQQVYQSAYPVDLGSGDVPAGTSSTGS